MTGAHQPLGFRQDAGGGTRHQVAADLGDDAEGAAVVAAFGNLQIGVVARGEPQAAFGHQVHELVGHGRQVVVNGADHAFILMRAGDGEDAGMGLPDQVLLDAEATGNDDATVLVERLADGLEALLLGAVEKAAGIDQHHIGAFVVAAERIALRAQGRHDALAVDKRLGAAEAD